MYITAVGYALPPHTITGDLLARLRTGTELDKWVSTRRTVLPSEYLAESRNADVRAALAAASHTPTRLGEEAVRNALAGASLLPEDIGLIIGDTATPLETCPSEGQRIGGTLGLKVPAYDLTGLSSAFPLHMETLLSWREETLPRYALCISTNLPTCSADYRIPGESALFGDAAGAVITSTEGGKFRILGARFETEVINGEVCRIGVYEHAKVHFGDLVPMVTSRIDRHLQECFDTFRPDPKSTWILPSGVSGNHIHGVVQRFGVDPGRVLDLMPQFGYSFGSTPLVTLGTYFDRFEPGDSVLVVTAGGGLSHGHVVMECQP